MPIFARPLPAILSRIPASRYCDNHSRHYRRCVFIGTYYSQQLHPDSLPVLPGWTHSLTDPIPSHSLTRPTLATRHALISTSDTERQHRGAGGKESLCGQELDGIRGHPYTA